MAFWIAGVYGSAVMVKVKDPPPSAPGLGLIGGALEFVVGMLWLNWRASMARKRGEGLRAA